MSLAALVAAAMFVGVLAYAVLGGADFGSGFYDLTAGGGRRGAELRTLIDHSIGPVWEANHVWLIFVLVMWWTGFPKAFAAATTTLFTPFMLALVGIVLRGASFAFRKYAATFAQAQLFGVVFAGSSLMTPFFFGTVAGAIASGRVPAAGYGDPVGSWVNPTSLVGGCLAVATCIFLAGVFLTADAARTGSTKLAGRLRIRTIVVGLAVGVIVFAGRYPVLHDAATLSTGLRGRAFPCARGRWARRRYHPGVAVSLRARRKSPEELRFCKDHRRTGGRGGDRRMGCGPIPVDAGRPTVYPRGRRSTDDPRGAARRRRARRSDSATTVRLPVVVHPIRQPTARENDIAMSAVKG